MNKIETGLVILALGATTGCAAIANSAQAQPDYGAQPTSTQPYVPEMPVPSTIEGIVIPNIDPSPTPDYAAIAEADYAIDMQTATAVQSIKSNNINDLLADSETQNKNWQEVGQVLKDSIVTIQTENGMCSGISVKKIRIPPNNSIFAENLVLNIIATSIHCRMEDGVGLDKVPPGSYATIKIAKDYGNKPPMHVMVVGWEAEDYATHANEQIAYLGVISPESVFADLPETDESILGAFSVNDGQKCYVAGIPFHDTNQLVIDSFSFTQGANVINGTVDGQTLVSDKGLSGGPLICGPDGGTMHVEGVVQNKSEVIVDFGRVAVLPSDFMVTFEKAESNLTQSALNFINAK